MGHYTRGFVARQAPGVPSRAWPRLLLRGAAEADRHRRRAPLLDLVFYHRILKCHVLIELKVDDFKHEHLGQLNTYVNWFRVHETAEGDNPPVGILLCTKKNHALVEFALAGMNNQLFVSKYQLALPKKKEIERFMEEQMMSEAAGVARSNRPSRAVVAWRRTSQGSVKNRLRTR